MALLRTLKILTILVLGLLYINNECDARAVNVSNAWTMPQEGLNVFYRFFRDRISWFEADAVCQFHHANLVTVDNSFQFDATRDLLRELDVNDIVWIGLMRPQSSERFMWSNSRPLAADTGYWAESLPLMDAPLCAVIDPIRDYRWHALRCGGPETASFLCEMPVPAWADDCIIKEMPALTMQYMADTASVEVIRNCGTEGLLRQSCKGREDRERIAQELICPRERLEAQRINDITSSHFKSLQIINSIPSDNNENNDIELLPIMNGMSGSGAAETSSYLSGRSASDFVEPPETQTEKNTVQKLIEQFNMDELMQADQGEQTVIVSGFKIPDEIPMPVKKQTPQIESATEKQKKSIHRRTEEVTKPIKKSAKKSEDREKKHRREKYAMEATSSEKINLKYVEPQWKSLGTQTKYFAATPKPKKLQEKLATEPKKTKLQMAEEERQRLAKQAAIMAMEDMMMGDQPADSEPMSHEQPQQDSQADEDEDGDVVSNEIMEKLPHKKKVLPQDLRTMPTLREQEKVVEATTARPSAPKLSTVGAATSEGIVVTSTMMPTTAKTLSTVTTTKIIDSSDVAVTSKPLNSKANTTATAEATALATTNNNNNSKLNNAATIEQMTTTAKTVAAVEATFTTTVTGIKTLDLTTKATDAERSAEHATMEPSSSYIGHPIHPQQSHVGGAAGSLEETLHVHAKETEQQPTDHSHFIPPMLLVKSHYVPPGKHEHENYNRQQMLHEQSQHLEEHVEHAAVATAATTAGDVVARTSSTTETVVELLKTSKPTDDVMPEKYAKIVDPASEINKVKKKKKEDELKQQELAREKQQKRTQVQAEMEAAKEITTTTTAATMTTTTTTTTTTELPLTNKNAATQASETIATNKMEIDRSAEATATTAQSTITPASQQSTTTNQVSTITTAMPITTTAAPLQTTKQTATTEGPLEMVKTTEFTTKLSNRAQNEPATTTTLLTQIITEKSINSDYASSTKTEETSKSPQTATETVEPKTTTTPLLGVTTTTKIATTKPLSTPKSSEIKNEESGETTLVPTEYLSRTTMATGTMNTKMSTNEEEEITDAISQTAVVLNTQNSVKQMPSKTPIWNTLATTFSTTTTTTITTTTTETPTTTATPTTTHNFLKEETEEPPFKPNRRRSLTQPESLGYFKKMLG